MKIAYLTVKLPYGHQETFIIPEIKEMMRLDNDILIVPFRPDRKIFHADAESLRTHTHRENIMSLKVVAGFAREFIRQPLRGARIIAAVISGSRNLTVATKNIVAIPKGFFAAMVFRRNKIEHIHAHWASTPSTVALIAARLTGIPWSFTAHRWDITENNLLKEKVSTATFARAIDEVGLNEIKELLNITDSIAGKIVLIHMGVAVPVETVTRMGNVHSSVILCPANLVPKKGHKYLIKACRLLLDRGISAKFLIAGDGPLEGELRILVETMELEHWIKFVGRLPHEKLIEAYREKHADLVVLPSIVTEDGEKEGIPVALMEAMAFGIPVISTETGGVPELVRNAGVLVPPGDAVALADAIARVVSDTSLYRELQTKGRRRVEEDFEIGSNTSKLLSLMRFESNGIHG